jgi:phosphate-selective porin OprO and OprP
LALRHSRTDLNFHEGPAGTEAPLGSVRGGEQSIFGAGVNWYLNTNVKLMFNYLHIDVDRLNPAGPDNLTPFGPYPGHPAARCRDRPELGCLRASVAVQLLTRIN